MSLKHSALQVINYDVSWNSSKKMEHPILRRKELAPLLLQGKFGKRQIAERTHRCKQLSLHQFSRLPVNDGNPISVVNFESSPRLMPHPNAHLQGRILWEAPIQLSPEPV